MATGGPGDFGIVNDFLAALATALAHAWVRAIPATGPSISRFI